MSKAALKKALKGMSQESLVETICELYDARKEAKEYLEYWLNPNPDKALEEAKERVDKMFFYSTGKIRRGPSATELKKLVKDFSSLSFDPEKIADLQLYIAERHYIWATQKRGGFLTAGKAVERSLEAARLYIEGAALEEMYGLRLERLTEDVKEFFLNPPEHKRTRRGWWR